MAGAPDHDVGLQLEVGEVAGIEAFAGALVVILGERVRGEKTSLQAVGDGGEGLAWREPERAPSHERHLKVPGLA